MWGRTSIHLMTVRAKEILGARYGAGPKYSYFVGGSTGGRQGMIEAQYYPEDYDGIVSKSPGMDYSHVMMSVLWTAQPIAENPDGVLGAVDRKVLNDAVLAACSGRDGVRGDPTLNDPRDCGFQLERLHFDKDADLVEKRLAPKIDATRTDLSRFEERGGKLIMTQGWSDDYQAATLPIEYYHRVLRDNGGPDARSSLREVQDFYRLFMVPGGGHVTGGPGPNSFDALSAVRNWVERGAAPRDMVATKYVRDRPENGVSMTRPLCPYPQVARHDGSGETSDASNFRRADDWGDFAADMARAKR
ncbi:tannase/feruloyl esterase family alpha/beta hydrolase [Streptomyces sp. NPDC059897]|uniref:tannase/feruloyl esterase family alpha/beta hydrolase n=1 Tax=Streptomyces sp. NPDC059897 TaxID=3346994 RepID=UPI003648150A